jgi:transposase
MQGQEALEQETKVKSSVGIDVCKSWLDAHVLPEKIGLRVANTALGIRKLKRWLAPFDVGLVAVEATGKWHRPLCRSLHAGDLAVAVVDPLRVRLFAKAHGILAKTDRLDAAVLARFAAVMAPPARAPAPTAMAELGELVAARQSAVAEETSLKNQRAAAEGCFLKGQLARRIARIGQDIKALADEIVKRIKADPELARRYAILVSIPGFGPVVAMTLIAHLAELGDCTARQIGSLAGLAPFANESGEHKGTRVIGGGRASVRHVLYLAAVTAARCNADLKAFYERHLAANKPTKVVLTAIARKLAVLANTLIAQDRPWQPHTPQPA